MRCTSSRPAAPKRSGTLSGGRFDSFRNACTVTGAPSACSRFSSSDLCTSVCRNVLTSPAMHNAMSGSGRNPEQSMWLRLGAGSGAELCAMAARRELAARGRPPMSSSAHAQSTHLVECKISRFGFSAGDFFEFVFRRPGRRPCHQCGVETCHRLILEAWRLDGPADLAWFTPREMESSTRHAVRQGCFGGGGPHSRRGDDHPSHSTATSRPSPRPVCVHSGPRKRHASV